MVINIKGGHSGTYFQDIHTALEEIVDTGIVDDADHIVDGGNTKQQRLIDELMEYREEKDRQRGLV
ncbi:hypothetical protein EST38_g117 [Candolleomyces aberdarensis]|uniref:Uncharacterized protein n=1 Tax=Candolleomyces aberdarensis TaxID=2316362 RepID=A0A4V1Q5J8_9AGAR|nr:hypothetical protein EST38_g117 [Candolleomyces aberdarensis]